MVTFQTFHLSQKYRQPPFLSSGYVAYHPSRALCIKYDARIRFFQKLYHSLFATIDTSIANIPLSPFNKEKENIAPVQHSFARDCTKVHRQQQLLEKVKKLNRYTLWRGDYRQNYLPKKTPWRTGPMSKTPWCKTLHLSLFTMPLATATDSSRAQCNYAYLRHENETKNTLPGMNEPFDSNGALLTVIIPAKEAFSRKAKITYYCMVIIGNCTRYNNLQRP